MGADPNIRHLLRSLAMVDQCDLGSPVCIDVLNESTHLTEGLPRGLLLSLWDANLSLPVSTVHPAFLLRVLPNGASTYVYILWGPSAAISF